MLLWSQRAGAGFGHADSAAVLLRANPALNESLRSGEGFVLAHYRLNRGRTLDPTQPIRRGERYPAARLRPIADLEMGLPLPDGWVSLNSVVERALAGVGELERPEHLLRRRNYLGTWHASGDGRSWPTAWPGLHRWKDDTALRRKPVARTCPYVIRALDDTTAGLVALRLADRRPAERTRGDPANRPDPMGPVAGVGLSGPRTTRPRPPLTTRLGFIVEGSAYQTPALLLEGELSLATGDSARAARAYTLASAFLSKPDAALQAEADSVRTLADSLTASVCGGDCGPYRW